MRTALISIIALSGAALVLSGCASAPLAPNQPPGSDGSRAHESWLPAGATVHRDLAYGTDANQVLDVYEPAGAQDAPVALMVHGGGWKRGDKAASGVVDNKVAHYLPMGYVVVSTNYRLAPEVDPVTEAGDVAAALAYVQANAREWGASASSVVLMGHSAGANLVALLAADPTIAERAGATPWLGTVVLDSAAFNVVTIMGGPHLPLYDPIFGTDASLQRESSPTLRLSTAPHPMFLVCDRDRANSCAQANAFAAKVAERFGAEAGADIHVHPVNLRHGQINSLLGTPIPLTNAVDGFLASLPAHNAHASSG